MVLLTFMHIGFYFSLNLPPWTSPCATVSQCHLFCLTSPPSISSLSLSLHAPGRPLPPTSSSTLLPPSLPSSSSAPHHPSPGPSPPIRECQVPLLEKNSTHSHLEPHPDDSYLLRAQPSSTGKRASISAIILLYCDLFCLHQYVIHHQGSLCYLVTCLSPDLI